MADCVWNYPIMHCKPLVIDYVLYAFVLAFWHARGLHTRTSYRCLATRHLHLATIFLPMMIGPFAKKLAPKTRLQESLWPSSKIFSLKHWICGRLLENQSPTHPLFHIIAISSLWWWPVICPPCASWHVRVLSIKARVVTWRLFWHGLTQPFCQYLGHISSNPKSLCLFLSVTTVLVIFGHFGKEIFFHKG